MLMPVDFWSMSGHLDLTEDREEWFLQAVWFQARKCNRLDLAKEWLKETPAKTRKPGFRRRAEAIMLQAQSDTELEAGAIMGSPNRVGPGNQRGIRAC